MNELLGIIVAIGIAYYIVSLVAAMFKLQSVRIRTKKPENSGFGSLPPVSILKPVNGIDGNLYKNLLSFVNQDYPEFEIIVGVQSVDDPAVGLVTQLKREYPEKKIHLVVSTHRLGFNPKVNNLYGMMPHASFDLMVISDSNVIVNKDYLRANVAHFKDKNVGLVTNLIRGVGGSSIGSLFENLHLNSFVIGNISLLSLLGKQIVVGKSMFFRKSQLDSLGGIWELRNYLAEDYLMGRMYKKHGYRVIVSPHLISSTNHSWTLKRFLNRHTRWAQLRWNLNKPGYVGELLANFSFWSLIYAAAAGFTYHTLLVVSLCWFAKITGDALMNVALNTGIGFRECLSAPIKDLVITFTWPVPLFHSRTKWRGNPVKITRDTLLLSSEK